ncbi:MAG: styrene monooxygenase/indole monooxygenase family protein [Advenella sp.]
MDKKIAIVGAGVGGLHLGLYLRQHDVDVTIYTDRKPEEYDGLRLLNTVTHHAITVAREKELGVNHWCDETYGYPGQTYYFGGEKPLHFRGDLGSPSRAVDYRIYLPQLMNDFLERGGKIQYKDIQAADLAGLAKNVDLVVVCVGKGTLRDVFARNEKLSPHSVPQRIICAGIYTGIADEEHRNVTLSNSPGNGEIIDLPTVTFQGAGHALLTLNIPGGDTEEWAHLNYDENPRRFLDAMLKKLEKYHPTISARIDPAKFDLANGSRDLLQGGVVPVVREGYIGLGDDKFAIALGDAHATVDPLMGQGANMASYSAFVLGEEIVKQPVIDERFCQIVDDKRRDRIECATHWTNLFLKPPRRETMQAVAQMSENRDMCDEFTKAFNRPEEQWNRFATGVRTQSWASSWIN